MQERRIKHIFPDLIFSKFAVVLALFLFLIILFGLVKGTIRSHQVNAEVTQLQDQISRLNKQNQDFNDLIKYLNTDTFIEQEAKLKLGLKKEDENVVIIPNSEINTKIDLPTSQTQASNPQKWWQYFFD